MKIKSLRSDLEKYLKQHNLLGKFNKQVSLFKQNPRHPSLHMEVLEPRSLRIYSFRIDRKYRVIFILESLDEVEIVDINNHYQ